MSAGRDIAPVEDGVLPVLYSFRRCPYAMRARLALAVSQVPVLLREVVLRDKPAALLAASPKATVPVLVLPDGRVIDQSLDIMLWAAAQGAPEGWLPSDDAANADAHAWVARCDGPFKRALDRFKYPNRYPAEEAEGAREACMAFAGELDETLASRPYLGRAGWGLADTAVAPFVRQFAAVDPSWFDQQRWPALKTWLTAFLESDLLSSVMDKYPPWQPGQPDLRFAPVRSPTLSLSSRHA